ncbi:MAG: hypothetical protein Q4F13_15535 [Pseudomonadota bacterium]|nr:hypothetical protein [Pseudomonadota bacterium]
MQRMLTSAVLAAGALGAAGVAQARDVYWSVGVGGPGVSVGFGNAPPVYVAPQPVYVTPPPVVVRPPRRPVYVAPAPVYYTPPPVVYQPGYRYPGYSGGYYHGRYDDDDRRYRRRPRHRHRDRDDD